MQQALIIWEVKYYKVLIFVAMKYKKNQSKSHYLSVVIFVLWFENITRRNEMGMDKIFID